MTKFYAEPLTCSTNDSTWIMPLPPLLNADDVNVKIELETDSSLFSFDAERSIVFLNKEIRPMFFNGKLCPRYKLLFLEFSLNMDETEISRQKFPISI